MKRSVTVIFLLFALLHCSIAAVGGNPFTVVIDAGHGGRDPGTITKRTKEKDINLTVALKVGALLKSNNPDIKVEYTRTSDVYIELNRRAEIANRKKADLFISIHSNAVKARHVSGTETFTLGLHRSDENLEVAKRENSVILMEDNYKTRYEGFDPNLAESYIIFELIQNIHLDNSISLAAEVQREFRTTARREDRGVRQAGLLVLRNTSMPSVLVELGFLSNPDEEQYLRSTTGQNALSRSIYRAIIRYRNAINQKTGGPIVALNDSNDVEVPNVETISSDSERSSDEKNVRSQPTPKQNTPQSRQTTTDSGKIVYKIQIFTHPQKLSSTSRLFKGLKGVESYKEGNTYKYTYKSVSTIAEAERERKKIAHLFKDAFVVKFRDGKRIK